MIGRELGTSKHYVPSTDFTFLENTISFYTSCKYVICECDLLSFLWFLVLFDINHKDTLWTMVGLHYALVECVS